MRIDVWADLVCPWCFIGKMRLQSALAESGVAEPVEVVHRAFQLNPAASSTSEPTVDHLASKYGVTRDQALAMMADVTEVAATEGLDYRLDLTMTGNTRDTHRTLLWVQATEPAMTQPLINDIYSAYFEHGGRIFSADDLAAHVSRQGLDVDAMRSVLATHDYLEQVDADQAAARELGAGGVPFFVFDGRIGVSGAQSRDVFLQAIERARTEIR